MDAQLLRLHNLVGGRKEEKKMVVMTCKCSLVRNSENSGEESGGKKMFIELMKKGKEDKMESEYSENMFLIRYCTEKVSFGRTSETTLTHLLLGCTRWARIRSGGTWWAGALGRCAS